MITLRTIDQSNFRAVMGMKRPEGETFVAPNAYSLAQAWLYRDCHDVFPYAIYQDEESVGFLLLREFSAARILLVWRIMFPPEHQNKGYGTRVLRMVMDNARAEGRFDSLVLTAHPDNAIGCHVYRKLGFVPTGNMEENGEMEMKLEL